MNNIINPSEDLPKKYQSKLRKWKKEKKQGTLDNTIINTFKKERIEYLLFDHEELSNQMTHKVCQFFKQNNKLPSQKAKDPNEKRMASWLNVKKTAKNGKTRHKLYESDQKIAESYDLNDLFNTIDLEELSNQMTHKICKFVKENNRIPNKRAKDTDEKKLGEWLRTRKKAKKGRGSFYESDQKIAESYGLPNLFEPITRF